MNKDIIEMQRGCNATCVIIPDENYQELEKALIMDANIEDHELYSGPIGDPIFKEDLEKISKAGAITYFVIRNIEELNEEKQNRYLGIVKDREFQGYKLPTNVIITFTIKNKENIKNISKDLYHYSVVAF